MHTRPSKSQLGFTLVEILVVILVIVVMMSLLLAAIAGARKTARRAVCMSNLKQLATAQHSYASANKELIATFSGLQGDELKVPDPAHAKLWPLNINAARHAWAIVADRLKYTASTVPNDQFIPDVWPALPKDQPFIFESFSHLVLTEGLSDSVLSPVVICPEDKIRPQFVKWVQHGFKPDEMPHVVNGIPTNWFPFSSTYQLLPANWMSDPRTYAITAGEYTTQSTKSKLGSHWNYVGFKERLGGRKISDISFASSKVDMADTQARHDGRRDQYYAYATSSQPLLFWDSSVSVRKTSDANAGWNRSTRAQLQNDSLTQDLLYTPDTYFESPTLSGKSSEKFDKSYYRWTRGGLRGVDFVGKEISTAKFQ